MEKAIRSDHLDAYNLEIRHFDGATKTWNQPDQKPRPVSREICNSTLSKRLIGDSAPIRRVRREIAMFSRSEAPVLVTGESGTGKELAARTLHATSARAQGPFIAINCGGLPPTLIASELFGHEKGTFTGATQRKIGLIEAANKGTLFLDEIGDLSLDLQPVFLRFLQESTIDRIGAHSPIKVDVRVIAATNKNIRSLADDRKFREDLLFRLNLLSLHLPPLRDCRSDILKIASYYIGVGAKNRWERPPELTPDARQALLDHHWPGNVRELIGRVQRALATSETGVLTEEDLGFRRRERRCRPRPSGVRSELRPGNTDSDAVAAECAPGNPAKTDLTLPLPAGSSLTLATARTYVEAALIKDTLLKNHNCVAVAARQLGVSKVTLYRLMKKLGIHTE